MFLQGDLQSVFDALFEMGIIDPVLEMDWAEAIDEMSHYAGSVDKAIDTANSVQGDVNELIEKLQSYDQQTLNYLAMEVAREFADFHAREELH